MLRRLSRIEADQHDLEVATGVERKHPHRARDGVQHLRAEHRARVVDERDDDGLRPEVLAQSNSASVLVAELQIERESLVDLLIEADGPERRRKRRCHDARRRPVARCRCAGHLCRGGGLEKEEHENEPLGDCHRDDSRSAFRGRDGAAGSGRNGNPRSSVNRMAS